MPEPCLVSPPAPDMAPLRVSAPAELPKGLLTLAMSESSSVIVAETTVLAAPSPAAVMVAGPLPTSSNLSDPPVPLLNVVVKAVPLTVLNVIDPTVMGASSEIVRVAVGLLKIADAPTALGIDCGFQLVLRL